jgi:hypothetical protein
MRIAGGVLLLLIGVFSLAEGGCVAIGCHAVGAIGKAASSALGAAGSAASKNLTADDIKKAGEAARADLEKTGAGLKAAVGNIAWISIVIRIAGLLCLVAGILFFVNKAKMFGFLAPAVGIIAEILLFVMMAFTIVGLVKILIYAFGLIAATKVGEQKAA